MPRARAHLIAKKQAGKVTDGWLAATEGFLRRAVAFFGDARPLDSIRPSGVREYATHLGTLPARALRKPRQGKAEQGKACEAKEPPAPVRTMTAFMVRAHLFALSNLYRRAQESEVVPLGFNPVAALMDKPAIVRREARWLEVPDAALYLEAARTLPNVVTAAGDAIAADLATPLVVTGTRCDTHSPDGLRRIQGERSWS